MTKSPEDPAFLESLQPTIEREAQYQVRRYDVEHLKDDVVNELNLFLLQDGPDGMLRQDLKAGGNKKLREAARNTTRRISGKRSTQAMELGDIDPPTMSHEEEETLYQVMDELSDVLKASYPTMKPHLYNILTNEVERALNLRHKTSRTDAERKLLERARNIVKNDAAPMLARFALGLLLIATICTGRAAASQHQCFAVLTDASSSRGHQAAAPWSSPPEAGSFLVGHQ